MLKYPGEKLKENLTSRLKNLAYPGRTISFVSRSPLFLRFSIFSPSLCNSLFSLPSPFSSLTERAPDIKG